MPILLQKSDKIIGQSSCELITVLTQHALDQLSMLSLSVSKASNVTIHYKQLHDFVSALQITAVVVEVKLPITNYCV